MAAQTPADDELPALAQLIEAAQGGDRRAREALAAAVRTRVVELVRQKLGWRLRRGAKVELEDVAHDVLAKFETALPKLTIPNKTAIRGWIGILVANHIRDLHDFTFEAKKRDPRRETSIEPFRDHDDGDDRSFADPSAESPLGLAANREFFRFCRSAMERLPADLADVVTAVELHGMNIPELARTRGAPESTLRVLHARGLATLAVLVSRSIRESSRRSS